MLARQLAWLHGVFFLGNREIFHSRENGEGRSAGFVQAVVDGALLEPPFPDAGLAAGFNLLTPRGVDHVGVVGGELLMKALRACARRFRCS